MIKGDRLKRTAFFAAVVGTIMRGTRGQQIATGTILTTGTTTTVSVSPALSFLCRSFKVYGF